MTSTVAEAAEWRKRYRSAKAFLDTDIGKAFSAYENALIHAAQEDGAERMSIHKVSSLWAASDLAQKEFVARLRAMMLANLIMRCGLGLIAVVGVAATIYGAWETLQ